MKNANLKIVFLAFVTFNFKLSTLNSWAQQPPQFTQYVFNNYMINPAVGGIRDYMDIKIGYRIQWIGIFGTPPKTMFASVTAPIKLFQEPQEYKKKYHGIGGSVSQDVAGPISGLTAKASYSYHKRLSRELWASAGIAGGVMQYRLNAGGLVAAPPDDPDFYDPDVRSISAITPDIQAGVWAYSDRFFAGFSIEQILPLNLGGTRSRLTHHYFFTGGYRYKYTPFLSFIPSAHLKFGLLTPATFDISLNVDYRNKYWGGVSYRKNDAVAILAGTVIGNIEIGYSYDYTLSTLRKYSANTHEIIIGFRYTKFEKEPRCPTWG